MQKNLAEIPETGSSEDLDFFDESNPRSLINLLPETARKCVLEIPEEFLNQDAVELEKVLKPNATDNRLRLNFWSEYDAAHSTGRFMKMMNIYRGVITKAAFYRLVLQDPKRLAWLLCPPIEYKNSLNEILTTGLNRLREIISAPVLDQNGNLMPKQADVVLKAYLAVESRVKGAVVQKVESKVEQKSVNVNFNENTHEKKAAMRPEELDARLSEVRAQLERSKTHGVPQSLKKSLTQAEVVEVTPLQSDND